MADAVPAPLLFNGLNGDTGGYLFASRAAADIAQAARGQPVDTGLRSLLRNLIRLLTMGHLGTIDRVDPDRLEQAGWGAIIPYGADPAILEALSPLFEHRRAEAASERPSRFKLFRGSQSYRAGEAVNGWLARQGATMGTVDPDRGVPYYLLIVGGPDVIPYSFQHTLDITHAVGRIHFDTAAEYRAYAESVVAAERASAGHQRRLTLAAVGNGDDPITSQSAVRLVAPLAASLAADPDFARWTIEHIPPSDRLRKAGLRSLFGGPDTPPLLFTSCHGLGFAQRDERWRRHQGALVSQDWPGPGAWGERPIPEAFYLSADDLDPDARVFGSVFFNFACFSAGTPGERDYGHHQLLHEGKVVAGRPCVAPLARRLLSHEQGGALAVIGHADRAWSASFGPPYVASDVTAFAEALGRLMRGKRVGHALEPFGERYAQLATDLFNELEAIKFGKRYYAEALAYQWMAHNDARAYSIVGDPAVRLRFAPDEPPAPPSAQVPSPPQL